MGFCRHGNTLVITVKEDVGVGTFGSRGGPTECVGLFKQTKDSVVGSTVSDLDMRLVLSFEEPQDVQRLILALQDLLPPPAA